MKIHQNISISGNGFIFNPTTGETFTVNPVGVIIIEMLKTDTSETDIRKQLLHKYNTDSATIEKDFYDFIQLLKSSNLIDDSVEKE